MTDRHLRRARLLCGFMLGLGALLLAFPSRASAVVGLPVATLAPVAWGLIGFSVAMLAFYLRPPRRAPSSEDREGMLSRIHVWYLVSCIGLSATLAGLGVSLWSRASILAIVLLVTGLIATALAQFPIANIQRMALVDPALNDERLRAIQMQAAHHAFNIMFTLALTGGAIALLYKVDIPTTTAFYGLAFAGALRQQLHLLLASWSDAT